MKAINFLEWSLVKAHDQQRCRETAEFYSQPFKPELITELFWGWEYVDSYRPLYKGYRKKIGADYNGGKFYDFYTPVDTARSYIQASNGFEYSTMQCKTLNDFISDCQRAGIELTWKSEIERKYFV